MRKLYTPLLVSILFTACGTQVNYLGSSYPQTKSVDVFVDRGSVKKSFDIIGKGYIERHLYSRSSVETIQKKAVEKAKLKGADAVLIEDYYVLNNAATITTHIDTINNTQSTNINPAFYSGLSILFLRYKE